MPEPTICPACGRLRAHLAEVGGFCGACRAWTGVHTRLVAVDEWTSIPPRYRPIERRQS